MMRKQGWNDRFNVTFSKDNSRLHEFYRQYFTKPPNARHISITASKSPHRRSSLPPELPRLDLGKGAKLAKMREKEWNEHFTVAFSKDNDKMHWTFREYFDSPRETTLPTLRTVHAVRRKGKQTAQRLSS